MSKYRNTGKITSGVLSLIVFTSSLECTRILECNWYLSHLFREKTDYVFL